MKDIKAGMTLAEILEATGNNAAPMCEVEMKMTEEIPNPFGDGIISIPSHINCRCTIFFVDDGIAFKEIPKE